MVLFSKQALPKSMTLTSPESRLFSNTFSGFKSQWMMLDSRSTVRASKICREITGCHRLWQEGRTQAASRYR